MTTHETNKNFLLSIIIAMAFTIVAVTVWLMTSNLEKSLIRQISITESQLIEHQFINRMTLTLNALQRMSERWKVREVTPFTEWQTDAANYVNDDEGLQAVVWVDGSLAVKWTEPESQSEQLSNLNLIAEINKLYGVKQDRSKNQSQGLEAIRKFMLSKPIKLANGNKAILAFFPLYRATGTFDGYIVALFDIEGLIASLLPAGTIAKYNMVALSENEHFFQQINGGSKFEFNGGALEIVLWPKASGLAIELSHIPALVLTYGLITSFLFAAATFFVLHFKVLKQKLAESENKYRAIIDNAVDGIITIDVSANIVNLNRSAQSIFGYTQQELIGKNIRCLMPEPYHGQHDQYIQNYLQTGNKKVIGIGRKVTGKRKDGKTFPMELGVSEFSAFGDRYFCGIVRDTTFETQLAIEKENLIGQLSKSNEELESFAYIASHDLKEPLRAIRNHASFLLEDYAGLLDESGNHKLNRLIYLSNRMEKLISDLLYFSRLGRDKINRQKVNIAHLLDDVKITLREAITNHNVEIKLVSEMPCIYCDPLKITELFYNLITNAYKYNRCEKKLIEIGCLDNHQGMFTIFVKDNGIGIDSKFNKDVFRIFKRLNSVKKFGDGTGVGLAFAKKIVEQHGGEIWFESALGQGTCFYFQLEDDPNDNQKTTHFNH